MAKSTGENNVPITIRGNDGRPHVATDMKPSDPKAKANDAPPPSPLPIRSNPD